ncbi:hypothetical protein D5018_19110 [Parashewanella curva]|uniref:Uncharacterized protein n=1 Tax=Parashewanella curva TaxID=2338552 RepID=A0A3L8PU07_9GAMM|nr:hypothetical protein D5018_19110 [Parashewanella curva]
MPLILLATLTSTSATANPTKTIGAWIVINTNRQYIMTSDTQPLSSSFRGKSWLRIHQITLQATMIPLKAVSNVIE